MHFVTVFFSLFIKDLPHYLELEGAKGVKLVDSVVLMYVDHGALTAETPEDLYSIC